MCKWDKVSLYGAIQKQVTTTINTKKQSGPGTGDVLYRYNMNDSPNFNRILIHQNDDGNSKNVRYRQPKSLAKDNKHKRYTMGMKLLCTCTTYKHVSSILYIISKDGRKKKKTKGRTLGRKLSIYYAIQGGTDILFFNYP